MTELLGRGDRYLSSGMLAVAADAMAAVEAAKRSAANAACSAAASAAAAAASASSAPLPADSANKNTATVTVVRGGSGVGGLEKAGSEKMGTATPARTASSLAAALALAKSVLQRSSSAPKATALIESITTSAGTWSSPFGAVSANAKIAAANEPSLTAVAAASANLTLARSQSLGGLPVSALDVNALCLAAGIVFPAEELSAI